MCSGVKNEYYTITLGVHLKIQMLPKKFMNIHVSETIKNKWPSHEFCGIPRKSKHGFTYIEAQHRTIEGEHNTFYYVFEADSFVDKEGIRCGAPELIFESSPESLDRSQAS